MQIHLDLSEGGISKGTCSSFLINLAILASKMFI